MSFSNSFNPDLDWSQIRETVRLLTLSAAQVDAVLREGDASVNILTEAFADIIEHMQGVSRTLSALAESETKTKALNCCAETSDKIRTAVIAFQFYDRMQQCLQHVTSNLRGLSRLVENPEKLHSPRAWGRFQSEIRARYTMESEKVMFDAILQGKTVDEAIAVKTAFERNQKRDIELF